MRATLDEFLAVLKELRVFVESIEPAYSMLARHEASILRESHSIRRRLDYAAFVVALYSAFERLVESLVWSHAELVASRKSYSDLPSKLQTSHLRNSADLLWRRLGEGRYSGIDSAEIVANLHSCLSGISSYKLNRHAVVHHDTNLRINVVQDMFGLLGIENLNARVRQAEPMLAWFKHSEGRDIEGTDSMPETLIKLRLEDLVDRRNHVAHSGGDPGESMAPEEMSSRLEFLEAYSRSLFAVIAGAYLEWCYVKTGAAHPLGRPHQGPYQKGMVAVMARPQCRLFAGQALFGRRSGQVDCWGRVTELKVEDMPVESVEENSRCKEVGLRADFKLTKGMELFVLEKDDEAVWG